MFNITYHPIFQKKKKKNFERIKDFTSARLVAS